MINLTRKTLPLPIFKYLRGEKKGKGKKSAIQKLKSLKPAVPPKSLGPQVPFLTTRDQHLLAWSDAPAVLKYKQRIYFECSVFLLTMPFPE